MGRVPLLALTALLCGCYPSHPDFCHDLQQYFCDKREECDLLGEVSYEACLDGALDPAPLCVHNSGRLRECVAEVIAASCVDAEAVIAHCRFVCDDC